MDGIIAMWSVAAALAAALKVATAPNPGSSWSVVATMALPFLAVAVSPVLGFRLAIALSPSRPAQPAVRLCRYGAWRAAAEAELGPATAAGPSGFLVSLIIGLMLNVPVRTLEFLAVVPAVNPNDPQWAQVLLLAMSADAVLMNFFYMACFAMALKRSPLLPRTLVLAWMLDLALQLAIAGALSRTELPPGLTDPLSGYLIGNMKKVMISIFVWLPYLILSDQVNLLFRHRIRTAA